jgi:hypothetical protein
MSTAVPVPRQLVKHTQGAGATPLPPAQKEPTGQGTPEAEEEPAGQPQPGALLQFAVQPLLARPAELP